MKLLECQYSNPKDWEKRGFSQYLSCVCTEDITCRQDSEPTHITLLKYFTNMLTFHRVLTLNKKGFWATLWNPVVLQNIKQTENLDKILIHHIDQTRATCSFSKCCWISNFPKPNQQRTRKHENLSTRVNKTMKAPLSSIGLSLGWHRKPTIYFLFISVFAFTLKKMAQLLRSMQ